MSGEPFPHKAHQGRDGKIVKLLNVGTLLVNIEVLSFDIMTTGISFQLDGLNGSVSDTARTVLLTACWIDHGGGLPLPRPGNLFD